MTDIVVIRGQGDKPGEDIIEPLLATINAALARGRAELDAATPAATVRLAVKFLPSARLGQLVTVHDAYQGASWTGKITGLAHQAAGGVIETQLDIWRPNEQ